MPSIDQYEFLEVPGYTDVRIPIVNRTSEKEQDSTGTRLPEWMVTIDGIQTVSTVAGFEKYAELYGFYCESASFFKGDSALDLYPSGCIWHSDVFLVTQTGRHTPEIRNHLNQAMMTANITIVRLAKVANTVHQIQTLTFSTCHWCGIQTYLDWTISRFTACKRTNTIKGFSQGGEDSGAASCEVDYTQNTVT